MIYETNCSRLLIDVSIVGMGEDLRDDKSYIKFVFLPQMVSFHLKHVTGGEFSVFVSCKYKFMHPDYRNGYRNFKLKLRFALTKLDFKQSYFKVFH